jgi:hypothetical protein
MPAKPALVGEPVAEERFDEVAVLVPCYNEEKTVGKVVRDFFAALPGARESMSSTTIPPMARRRPRN